MEREAEGRDTGYHVCWSHDTECSSSRWTSPLLFGQSCSQTKRYSLSKMQLVYMKGAISCSIREKVLIHEAE